MNNVQELINRKKEVYLNILKLTKLLEGQSGGGHFNTKISETIFMEQDNINNIIDKKIKIAKNNNSIRLDQAFMEVINRHNHQ
jgi:hypothetical protein